ncbi:hypothetical protein DFH11DRAFT_431371 [Phellopilus nigrolimitatus]|nr:hypothetical protein DFH11DRAFT_431371 [Phellopilus nigrolimitatus]
MHWCWHRHLVCTIKGTVNPMILACCFNKNAFVCVFNRGGGGDDDGNDGDGNWSASSWTHSFCSSTASAGATGATRGSNADISENGTHLRRGLDSRHRHWPAFVILCHARRARKILTLPLIIRCSRFSGPRPAPGLLPPAPLRERKRSVQKNMAPRSRCKERERSCRHRGTRRCSVWRERRRRDGHGECAAEAKRRAARRLPPAAAFRFAAVHVDG